MTNTEIKNLAFLISWTLGMAYLLIYNFSWIALGVLALLVLFALYLNIFKESTKYEHMTSKLPFYVILSNLFVLTLSIMRVQNSFFVLPENYIGILSEKLINSVSGMGILLVLIALVLLLIMSSVLKKHAFLSELCAYLVPFCIFGSLFFCLTDNANLLLAYAIVMFTYVFSATVKKMYNDEKSSLAKLFFVLTSLAYLFILFVNKTAYDTVLNPSYPLENIIEASAKWHHTLFLLVMAGAVLVVTIIFRDKDEDEDTYDAYLAVFLTSLIPVLYFVINIYVGYRWLVLALYAMIVLFVMLKFSVVQKKIFKDDDAASFWTYYLTVPIISVLTIFITFAGHYGKLITGFVFSITTLIAFACYLKIRKIADHDTRSKWIHAGLLTWIYLNTLARLMTYHRHWYVILVVSAVYLVFTVLVLMMNHNPKIYQKNSILHLGQWALPVLFMIVCLISPMRGGTTINIVPYGEQSIYFEVQADGNDNYLKSIKYCWIDTVEEYASLLGNENSEVYQDGNKQVLINLNKTGLLKIIAVDKYDIVTTCERWYYVPTEELPMEELPSEETTENSEASES